jgi:hypothetical protein
MQLGLVICRRRDNIIVRRGRGAEARPLRSLIRHLVANNSDVRFNFAEMGGRLTALESC